MATVQQNHCSGVIALFGSEPFSSKLRLSNLKDYKYDWIWNKRIPSGMCNAKIQPMRQTENISIFIKGKSHYNPQMMKRDKPIKSGGMKIVKAQEIQAVKEFIKLMMKNILQLY